MSNCKKCKNCIWFEDCESSGMLAEDCDDYTPYDDELELNDYENDLILRENTYKEQIKEQRK